MPVSCVSLYKHSKACTLQVCIRAVSYVSAMAMTGLSPASQRLLREVQSTVADLCTTSTPGKPLSSTKLDKLRSVVFALKTSIGQRQHCSPSDKNHETLWNAVCDLWVGGPPCSMLCLADCIVASSDVLMWLSVAHSNPHTQGEQW